MKREENQTIEYKESWHEKYLEWICGYANAKGGTLYIGIEDGTKKPVGVARANKLMEDIPNSIRNTMGIVADVVLVKKQGKDVIRIKVKTSAFPVSYHGGYFYRTGSVKMQLVGNALTEFLMEKSGVPWDSAPTLGGFKRLDHAFTALCACYRKERKVSFANSDYESFGLETSDGVLTNTGALMADDCPLTHSRVFCTRWNGLTMAAGVMDAKDDQEYTGGILSLLRYAEDFVHVNSRHAWHKLSRSRAEFCEYPERAVHEALVNAFIHRDYLELGSEVHVDIFDDRLEITSPGGMPDGRRIEDYDVHRIPSVRRNKRLADMCERLKIMERRGSGFKKIFEDYERLAENPGKRTPQIEAEPTYFRITLPNLIYGFTDAELTGAPVMAPVMAPVAAPVAAPVGTRHKEHQSRASETLINEVQRRIIGVLGEGEKSTAELAKAIGITQPKHLRVRYLRYLLDANYIECTIRDKPNSRLQRYRLTIKGREIQLTYQSVTTPPLELAKRLEDNASSMPNSGSTMPNSGSTMPNSAVSMPNNGSTMPNNGDRPELAAIVCNVKRRVSPAQIENIVCELCSVCPLKREQIAHYLNRGDKYVRAVLGRLLKSGRLRMTIPEMPKHPHQTYIAVQNKRESEGS